MSRIGKKGITIPEKTEVTTVNGVVSIKGPKGSIERSFGPAIEIKIEGKEISFAPLRATKQTKSLWGTVASHVGNMIKGVNEGFEKKLLLEGVGYKSEVKGKDLVLALGFSHPVIVAIPEGLTVEALKNNITIKGIDKELVGQFAASVRALKKPEPYKGKGFRYDGEVIRRKQGKKSA
jgi:large subunit ribosomal protein L6